MDLDKLSLAMMVWFLVQPNLSSKLRHLKIDANVKRGQK